jgi:hypothetical protein
MGGLVAWLVAKRLQKSKSRAPQTTLERFPIMMKRTLRR